MNQFSKKYYLFLIVFLGILSAFGPFVTDMYLPTLPSLAEIFHATPSEVQLGLAASMVGLAIGQIFFGPLSDKYGRRPILIVSMILFAVSTVGCIYSPTIKWFNIYRFLQGLGGSGGVVLARSISTDLYKGRDLAKIMGIIGAIVGIAPVTAPVIGGLVSDSVGWQGIFWILFGLGVMLLVMCLVFRESNVAEKRYKGSVGSLLKNFYYLLKIKYYVIYVLLFSFSSGVLFAYVASAAFIIQNHYGFSELAFSLFFAINASGIGIGSALSIKCRTIQKASLIGSMLIFVMVIFQWCSYLISDSFICYEIFTFLMMNGVGYIFTSASTLSMEEGRKYVGAAAAVLGALGFLFGGIVSPLVGIGEIMSTTLIIQSANAVLVLLFALIGYRRRVVPSVVDSGSAAKAE